jgi:hypothetical protein
MNTQFKIAMLSLLALSAQASFGWSVKEAFTGFRNSVTTVFNTATGSISNVASKAYNAERVVTARTFVANNYAKASENVSAVYANTDVKAIAGNVVNTVFTTVKNNKVATGVVIAAPVIAFFGIKALVNHNNRFAKAVAVAKAEPAPTNGICEVK